MHAPVFSLLCFFCSELLGVGVRSLELPITSALGSHFTDEEGNLYKARSDTTLFCFLASISSSHCKTLLPGKQQKAPLISLAVPPIQLHNDRSVRVMKSLTTHRLFFADFPGDPHICSSYCLSLSL